MKHLSKFENFEPINEGLGSLIGKGISYLLSPLVIPIWANANTDFKLRLIKSSIDKYIKNKAHYEMLDEWKYDQDFPPSKNKMIMKKLLGLKKDSNLVKYPTIQDYGQGFIKTMEQLNLINFRNREDIEYVKEKIMEYCNRKPESELLEEVKEDQTIDPDTLEMTYRNIRGRGNVESEFQRRLRELHGQRRNGGF